MLGPPKSGIICHSQDAGRTFWVKIPLYMTILPPPLASKQVKQQNYKYLLLPSQVCGAFYVGPEL